MSIRLALLRAMIFECSFSYGFFRHISRLLLALLSLALSLELRVVVVAGVGSGDVEAIPKIQPLVRFASISYFFQRSVLPVDVGHSKSGTFGNWLA